MTPTTNSTAPFRVIVVGLGVQGTKRRAIAGSDLVATVDPAVPEADYAALDQVDPDSYGAALLCVPDGAKPGLLDKMFARGKHVLVEKPLVAGGGSEAEAIHAKAAAANVVCYTAYNHRFEPHLASACKTIRSGALGTLYRIRMFYGNGTAANVKASLWRDQGSGVLHDLGCHLLDLLLYWGIPIPDDLGVAAARSFENRAFDHVVMMGFAGTPAIELEMSLLAWRNSFTVDIFGSAGSLHVDGLCKWGQSSLTQRQRVLPSGRPPERVETLSRPDPTWEREYAYFKHLCHVDAPVDGSRDVQVCGTLRALSEKAMARIGQ